MADKKTSKAAKPAKKAMKKESLAVKSIDELKTDLSAKLNDMLESRRSHRAGELVNPRVITHSRKEIARLKTAIRAHELKEAKNG